MQNHIRGAVSRKSTGWRRSFYLGHGPAMQVLLASMTAFAAGCSGRDAAPETTEKGPVAIGTARAPMITNSVLEVVGDTFVRQATPDENEGALPILSVQTASRHRTLLFFDTEALRAAVGNGTVLSARIDLFIDSNLGGWGSGRAIAIHALRQPSSEAGATWSCAADANIQNQFTDCSGADAWNMSGSAAELPYVSTPTATAVIANGTLGVVSFDVTPNVLEIMAGIRPGHGWLIKKVDETVTGTVHFVSREQGPAPRLTLMIDAPDPCTPIAETDVTCDTIDDDCDGAIDDDFVPVPTTCGVGACMATGTATCLAGELQDDCAAGIPAATDATCDGIDDDCDGASDEEFAPVATECGVGACRASGATSCVEGSVVDGCVPGPAAVLDETCDGVDDDCDGAADEEFAPHCAGTSAVTCVDGSELVLGCSDDDACNGDEGCEGAAICVAGTPPVLDDADPCTIDACDPTLGATHALAATGTTCGEYRECNDQGQCLSILPPDPAEVAPLLPAGRVSFIDRVRFMYETEPSIQTGVTAGAIQARSAAVVRGRVLGPNGLPLPKTKVTIHGHPEYGETESRLDGTYDLVVNGGGPLTLRFERQGALETHRTVPVPWLDYTTLDDVALTAPDARVTQLPLPSTGPVLHDGSVTVDARGTRRARLFVPTATDAALMLPDGSTAPAPTLSIRASEFGADATRSLPALLPETSAPAYALELSADEAVAATVELDRDLPLYVDNFLHFPIGSTVPFGMYDRATATWRGLPNGRVLALVGVEGGLAVLDMDGSGNAATADDLAALGIGAEERTAIAQAYSVGDAFFRLAVRELGVFGVALPFAVDAGSEGVEPDVPGQIAPLDDATFPAAPAETEVLAQSLPLAGTPFTLEYRSNRVLGDRRGRTIHIPVMGASLSDTVLGGLVDVHVAGQRETFSILPEPSAAIDYTWDGEDIAGRLLHGWQRVEIRVGLLSPRRYVSAEDYAQAFGHTAFGGAPIGDSPEADVRWRRYDRMLHAFDSRQTDIGAWAIDQHHQYDPTSRVVYLGDGRSYPTRTSSTTIERFAGKEQFGMVGSHSGDGGPALLARMDSPRSVAVAPDGSLYIGTRNGVRRVAADTHVMTTVAGGLSQSQCDASASEGPGTEMCIFARTIDFGRDGALYIADNPITSGSYDRILRLDPETGWISHVAGVKPTAGCANMGDGGLARDAAICNLTAHASAPDGSIYLLDRGNAENPEAIRKISPDGVIDTIGTADWSAADDAAALAVGPDGSLYVAQTRAVLRVLPTGEVIRFAGNLSASGNYGEGGPATLARFGNNGPSAVLAGPDGRVFIGDNGNGQVRMVDQQGIIRRVVGTTPTTIAGNGGSPLLASLGSSVFRSALAPDGTLYVAQRSNHSVRAVRPLIAGDFSGEALVPSPDGSELYRFAADGRHLDTTSAATGELEYSFGYDEDGLLVEVTDGEGNLTFIERDENGDPIRIIAPGGQVTELDTDADGYVSLFIEPDGTQTELTYAAGGLLTTLVDADGVEHVFAYDADGRLLAP